MREVPREEQTERLRASLAQVGLSDFAERRISGLSGGQRQRAAIARMLARDVELVVADEPTANLDPERVVEIVALLRGLAAKAPVIVVTHDPHVAECCDRTIVLQAAAGDRGPVETKSAPAAKRSSKRALALAAIVVAVVLVADADDARNPAQGPTSHGSCPGLAHDRVFGGGQTDRGATFGMAADRTLVVGGPRDRVRCFCGKSVRQLPGHPSSGAAAGH